MCIFVVKIIFMNDYIELRFNANPCDEIVTDVLASMLCDVGFESFVPDSDGLTAYIKKELYNKIIIEEIVSQFPLDVSFSWSKNEIEGCDWNSEWEKNYFQPIIVKDKCVIHSSFHKDIPKLPYDIVIDPKMAFGTGHHATTSLIIEQLLSMKMSCKSVIDMGTGTGILAILSAMRGAKPVSAIEIDEFAYVNAVENVKLNGTSDIKVIHGDVKKLRELDGVDVFLANINRNIIIGDLSAYSSKLKVGGVMLLSGFYENDIKYIVDEAKKYGLEYDAHTLKDQWSCIRLIKM